MCVFCLKIFLLWLVVLMLLLQWHPSLHHRHPRAAAMLGPASHLPEECGVVVGTMCYNVTMLQRVSLHQTVSCIHRTPANIGP